MKTGKSRDIDPTIAGSETIQRVRVGSEEAVIVPLGLWERIVEQLEELYDLQCYDGACGVEEEDLIEHGELCCILGKCPLAYYRTRAGMSQGRLAQKVGVSQSYIAKVESGERCLSKAVAGRIAREFKLPPDKLIPK